MQVILENIERSSTSTEIIQLYKRDNNLCLCYLLYFLIKVAIIKKKSNLSYLNTNQKPFAYCQIMPALVSAYPIPHKEPFDAHNLCYQISSGTCMYMTEEQEDILGKNYSNVV